MRNTKEEREKVKISKSGEKRGSVQTQFLIARKEKGKKSSKVSSSSKKTGIF